MDELKKLPDFLQVSSPNNMLTHVGHDIPGMNVVQLYLKMAGNRTGGHQENNNFNSVNICIGPGSCEWFACANDDWEKLAQRCEENGQDFQKDSWWPNLEDCTNAGIPIFRFEQKPGDIVYVNIGTPHWVQALEATNNIAWNLGYFNYQQYRAAVERFEFNKTRQFMSLVPMTRLSWNIARHTRKATIEVFFKLVK